MLHPFLHLSAGIDHLSDTSSFRVSGVTGTKKAEATGEQRNGSPESSHNNGVVFAMLTQSHCPADNRKHNVRTGLTVSLMGSEITQKLHLLCLR